MYRSSTIARRHRCSLRSRTACSRWAGCFSIRRPPAIPWRQSAKRSPAPRSCARPFPRSQAIATSPADLADVDFAIVRASFAIAETGSAPLSDADLHVNAVAYLAQHLIVLLDPADIVVNLHHAYGRPEFRDRRYASFHTGPSATADIEGMLIHGAQGVRSLSVLPIARAAGNPTS
jgi:L-lactate utilization protein LutC